MAPYESGKFNDYDLLALALSDEGYEVTLGGLGREISDLLEASYRRKEYVGDYRDSRTGEPIIFYDALIYDTECTFQDELESNMNYMDLLRSDIPVVVLGRKPLFREMAAKGYLRGIEFFIKPFDVNKIVKYLKEVSHK